ncbi:MAG: lipoate--protein ligase family protein [Burkholderiales bacterium]
MLDLAAAGRAVASLWEAPSPALVAPRSYRRYERFKEVGADFAHRGMPVLLRQSGGGVVPQGPGILNLSVAFAVDGPHARSGEWIYESLCELMLDALATLGVDAEPRAVAGSFCDGRFNLAVGGRKLAGTAQYWKPLAAGRQAVLAHALLLVDIDPEVATVWANAFEAALGSGRAYDPDAVTSVVRCLPADRAGLIDGATLRDRVRDALLLALG